MHKLAPLEDAHSGEASRGTPHDLCQQHGDENLIWHHDIIEALIDKLAIYPQTGVPNQRSMCMLQQLELGINLVADSEPDVHSRGSDTAALGHVTLCAEGARGPPNSVEVAATLASSKSAWLGPPGILPLPT